jgi:hypothetical protein
MAELSMTITIKKSSDGTAGSDIEKAAKAAMDKIKSIYNNNRSEPFTPKVLRVDVRAIPNSEDSERVSEFEVTVVCEVGGLLGKLTGLQP